jgi:polyisoprenoid-binding protein YceI
MNAKIMSLAAVLLLSATAHAESVPWNLDPAHAHIGFTARHLGFAKVNGQFKKFSAKIEADAKTGKITKLEAEADAKSVDTGVEKRDNHLRSDDFFGADKYPTLKLELKTIKWKGKAFTATVALTIRDVTKDVKLDGTMEGPQTVNFGQGPQQRAAFEAHAKIKRKDFGLKFAGLVEGISIVGDDVEMTIETELSMAQPAPAPASAQTAAPATGKAVAAAQPAASPAAAQPAPAAKTVAAAPPAAKPGAAMTPAAKAPAPATAPTAQPAKAPSMAPAPAAPTPKK